jgi:hypothetical protein
MKRIGTFLCSFAIIAMFCIVAAQAAPHPRSNVINPSVDTHFIMAPAPTVDMVDQIVPPFETAVKITSNTPASVNPFVAISSPCTDAAHPPFGINTEARTGWIWTVDLSPTTLPLAIDPGLYASRRLDQWIKPPNYTFLAGSDLVPRARSGSQTRTADAITRLRS